MSYLTQMRIAADQALLERVTACAGILGVSNPSIWVYQHVWEFTTQPGWVEAYQEALRAQDENPGLVESVITDEMILSSVQAVLVASADAATAEDQLENPA